MEDNYILAEINIQESDINKDIRIINSYGNYLREEGEANKLISKLFEKYAIKEENDKDKEKKEYKEYQNEDEINEKCEIEINGEPVPFNYYKKFDKAGKYLIKYIFDGYLTKSDYMFYNCFSLTKIDLSHFKAQYITNMGFMFCLCDS